MRVPAVDVGILFASNRSSYGFSMAVVPAQKLKKTEITKLKSVLDEEKRKILRHLENLSESSETEMQTTSGDQADLASLEINQANLTKIGKREEFLLKKIDLALKKIEEGEYGLCENCGDPIGYARLMARPVAQLCIDCKTEQESHERKFSNRDGQDGEDDDSLGDESDDTE